jgi:hypothetical protein
LGGLLGHRGSFSGFRRAPIAAGLPSGKQDIKKSAYRYT